MDAANLDVSAESGPRELKQIYQANLGYDVDQDATQCQRFIKACRAIISLPADSTSSVEGVRFDRSLVSDELAKAVRWMQVDRTIRPRVFVVHPEWSR